MKKTTPAKKRAPAKKQRSVEEAASPAELIAELVNASRHLSDPQLLAAIAALPPLRDEDDPAWNDPDYWSGVAYPYLALADLAADRRLRPAIRLLLDRACFGDPGEIMRGMRHGFEAIVNPDWDALADICIAATESPRLGTVLWAADQLMILDDPRAHPVFERLAKSPHERIRDIAEIGLERLVPGDN